MKRLISERIGPEQCAELDLDSGALTILDETCGIELQPVSVLRLAAVIASYAPIIALFIEKGSE